MKQSYYREKIISLIDKIFIETGDARSRITNCETKIFNAYLASNSDGVPRKIKDQWEVCWNDLNNTNELVDNNGKLIQSSLSRTVNKRKNKSMEKYLLFFLSEFYRVL